MEWWEDIYNRQIYFDLYEEEDTRLAEKEVQQVVTLLHPLDEAHILDLCCGYGRHSIPLAQRGFHVTGVDISGKQIQTLHLNNTEGMIEAGNNLVAGVYFYSLYSNDKIIARNTMVVR